MSSCRAANAKGFHADVKVTVGGVEMDLESVSFNRIVASPGKQVLSGRCEHTVILDLFPGAVAAAQRCAEAFEEDRRYMIGSQEVHAGQYRFARKLYEEAFSGMLPTRPRQTPGEKLQFCITVQRYAAKKSHLCRARLGIEEYEGD